MYVGERRGAVNEKNASLLFEALLQMPANGRPQLVFLGGHPELEPELAALAAGIRIFLLSPATSELPAIYAGATALVITAIREGANISALEAMASGCPVIAVRNATTEFLVGDAGVLVDWSDADALATALLALREGSVRDKLINAGLERAAEQSQANSAKKLADVLTNSASLASGGTSAALNAVWDRLVAVAREADEQRRGVSRAGHGAMESLQSELADAKAGAQSLRDLRLALDAELVAAQADASSLRESRAVLESELVAARTEAKSLDDARAKLALSLGKLGRKGR